MTPKGYKKGYQPVLPLDELILRQLPDEGSVFAEVFPEGKSAKELSKVIANGKLDTMTISTRLRVMMLFEMAVAVKTVRTASNAYQITAKGKQFLVKLDKGKGAA